MPACPEPLSPATPAPAMDPPACPGPPPHQHRPRLLRVPAGAVDTHAHVIGAPPLHPLVAQRSYTPPPASAADYLAMLDATGMDRGVLVQVSVHGTDNRLLLQTLSAHPKRLRGVAVMPLGLPERDYRDARAAGVVALRLNVLYGGGIGLDALADYAALAREMGWHLQLLVDLERLAALGPRLARLPVPVVVDHMGHFRVEERPAEHPLFRNLVALVRDGVWVKLSGAYRLCPGGPPYEAVQPHARTLFEAAPDRCVWGSDWPHVSHHGPMMGVDQLLDALALWLPWAEDQHRVLVANPWRLYGFGSCGHTGV